MTPVKSLERPQAGNRKMWVCVKQTGEFVEINLDRNRPISFDSKEAEVQWERASALNALKFISYVESDNFVPHEVRLKLEEKTSSTPEEQKFLESIRKSSLKQEKLKVEQRLTDIHFELQKSVCYDNPDMLSTIELLDELQRMSICPLVFKKHPKIVETVRKLCNYVGPAAPSPDANKRMFLSEKIRLAAADVLKKIQHCFGVDGNVDFIKFFAETVAEFKAKTRDYPRQKMLYLVTDPTRKESTE